MFNEEIKNYIKKEVIQKKNNPIFLETGFHIGDSAVQALELGFSKVISIEIDDKKIEEGKKRLKKYIDNKRLILVKGDSAEKICEYFNSNIDVTFLDAHGQFEINQDTKVISAYADETNAKEKIISAPLERELEYIQKNIVNDQIIIIDDYIKIKNAFYYQDDNWKSKFENKKLKNILKNFDRNLIEFPYVDKEYSFINNSYLIIYNEKLSNKITTHNLLIKNLKIILTIFRLEGLNFFKRKLLKVIIYIFGENFYKKIRSFIKK